MLRHRSGEVHAYGRTHCVYTICQATGKVSHHNRKQARRHLKELRHADATHRRCLHVYRCERCGGYHVGRQPPILSEEESVAYGR